MFYIVKYVYMFVFDCMSLHGINGGITFQPQVSPLYFLSEPEVH